MRVLYVLPALEENGGVRNAMQVAEALAAMEVEVTVFSVRSRSEGALDPSRVRRPVVFGADRPVRLRRNPGLVHRLFRAARANDLVVSTYEVGLGLVCAVVAAMSARRPAIAWVQSNLVASLPRVPTRDRVSARLLYPRVDGVLLANQDLRPTLRAVARRPLRRVGWADNGIDATAVREAARAPAEAEPDGLPSIVAVGRLSKVKGFDVLLRAHAAVLATGRLHRLVFVGEGSDRAELEQLARELGVVQTTRFLGHLDNPHAVVARAALFCFPSRFEASPLALLEALVLGAPTIAADCVAGPRRLLRDGAYGDLVAPESPDQLAEAIARHLDQPSRLRSMAAEGARWAEQFTVRRCAEQHRAFYQEVLAAG